MVEGHRETVGPARSEPDDALDHQPTRSKVRWTRARRCDGAVVVARGAKVIRSELRGPVAIGPRRGHRGLRRRSERLRRAQRADHAELGRGLDHHGGLPDRRTCTVSRPRSWDATSRCSTRAPAACTVWSSATRAASSCTESPLAFTRAGRDRRAACARPPSDGCRALRPTADPASAARRPRRRVRRVVPACARARFGRAGSSPTSRARNLTEQASPIPGAGVPAGLLAARRSRASSGSCDFDALAGDELPAARPPIPTASCSSSTTSRSGAFPETAPHIDERWRRRFAGALAGAPRVIVPSERDARRDLLDASATSTRRGSTSSTTGSTPNAFAPVRQAGVDAGRARASGSTVPYVLFVGGIEPRKNLDGSACEAFAQRRRADARRW